MPISEKILEELSNLTVSEDQKELMKDILFSEDYGVAHYKAPYEKLIKDYLAKNSDGKEGKKK